MCEKREVHIPARYAVTIVTPLLSARLTYVTMFTVMEGAAGLSDGLPDTLSAGVCR